MAALEPPDPDSFRARHASARLPRGLIALGAFLLLYASWQAFHWFPGGQALIGDLAFVPVNGAAIYTAWRASQRARASIRLRQAWRLVALALAVYLVGDLAELVYEVGFGQKPYPSIADGLYLSFYPILLFGLLRFPSARRAGRRATELAIDIAIVTIGGSALFLYVALGPTAITASGAPLQAAFSIAYPVGDVVLLVGLASVLMRGGPKTSRSSLRMMMAALVAFVTTDLVYGYTSLHGVYTGGGPVDMLWIVAIAVFAVAPTLQRPAERDEPEEVPVTVPSENRVSWLPYGAVVIGFGMLAVAQRDERFFPEQILAIVAIVLAALVAARQLLAQRRLVAVQQELREAHDELAALASTDSVTGLKNHRWLVDAIGRELARSRRLGRPFALLFVDVDDFKVLNDTFGHLAGDEALRAVGELLGRSLREIDVVGRWGGEEFVAVLTETTTAEASATADRIRATVAQHGFEGGRHRLTCSIGVAGYPEDAAEPYDLVRLADTAMYAAKRRGRNCTIAANEGDYDRNEIASAILAGVDNPRRPSGELMRQQRPGPPRVDDRGARVLEPAG